MSKNNLPKGPVFVLDPAGVAGSNVYIDWTTLYNALSEVVGPATVEVVGVAHMISAGAAYVLDEVTFVTSVPVLPFGTAQLIIDAGATIAPGTLHIKDGLVVQYTGTGPGACMTATPTAPAILDISEGATLECSGAGPFVTSPATSLVFALLSNGATLGGSNNTVVQASGGQALVQATGRSTVNNDSIAATSGTAVLRYDDTTQPFPTLTLPGVTLQMAAAAGFQSYTPDSLPLWGGTAPTSTANALDQLAAGPLALLFGTGSDGAVTVNANTTAAGYNATTFHLTAGATLRPLAGWPLVIRATESITIDTGCSIITDGGDGLTGTEAEVVGQFIGSQVPAPGGSGGGGGGGATANGSNGGGGSSGYLIDSAGAIGRQFRTAGYELFGMTDPIAGSATAGGAGGASPSGAGQLPVGSPGVPTIGTPLPALVQLARLPGGQAAFILYGLPGAPGASGGSGGNGGAGGTGTGGAGGTGNSGGLGGFGATSIILIAPTITIANGATLSAQGLVGSVGAAGVNGSNSNGTADGAGGGGGGGGGGQGGCGAAIVLIGETISDGSTTLLAGGGPGGGGGGGSPGTTAGSTGGIGGNGTSGANGAFGSAGTKITITL